MRQNIDNETVSHSGNENYKSNTRFIWLFLPIAILAVVIAVVFLVTEGKSEAVAILDTMSEDEVQQPRSGLMKIVHVDSLDLNMVYVKGGTFQMGAQPNNGFAANYDSEARSNEYPVHCVTLSDYYIGETEVTQVLWKAVMGCNPSNNKGDSLPVENVSWDDVQIFIKKLNHKTGLDFRLPTEAEWEYAARGGNMSHGYKYSGSDNIDEVAWYDDNSGGTSHPVKKKKSNELGLYDMTGNLWEWCEDEWYEYNSEALQDPHHLGSNGSHRVFRDGSWFSYAWRSHVSRRDGLGPAERWDYLGFRLAL